MFLTAGIDQPTSARETQATPARMNHTCTPTASATGPAMAMPSGAAAEAAAVDQREHPPLHVRSHDRLKDGVHRPVGDRVHKAGNGHRAEGQPKGRSRSQADQQGASPMPTKPTIEVTMRRLNPPHVLSSSPQRTTPMPSSSSALPTVLPRRRNALVTRIGTAQRQG